MSNSINIKKTKKLTVIGIGPGGLEHMTEAAIRAIDESSVVVGYTTYIDLIQPLLGDKEVYSTGMRGEVERVAKAVELADAGGQVAVVSSGDAGVYGMAGLALELLDERQMREITFSVIPGVTAATAAAAIAGAPIMHDFCVISLSDLLTDSDLIKKRLRLAAEGDFVTILYNPKSRRRVALLQDAVKFFLRIRTADTPVAMVSDATREGETVLLITLAELPERYDAIGMTSIVIIGNSSSYRKGDWIVTPRGYRLDEKLEK